ncbi:hypothetical protein BJM02_00335 [Mycobacterium tuberculosis]|nr:hypothetical protein CFBS_0066 [Mycobacterium tuberculosis CCDC5079]AHJ40712.1 hypothetical protein HKBS1_0066 [Mycobacterium tuberculosis HKBS1]AHJ44863.1 hypothetical protein HKBT2_0066 [Mycobacterium tuberculosis BT2]AHJ49012.1 hypothetical protein HKBT1_0066 [Mycobacterium tuberculosis BT1]AHJ53151.1 hypothetical protein CFBR_0066 [Mycobacterium tuberculosis CCDC5180]AIQ02680.1 hypothetical protein LJ70_00350 [Mycobacterium tuberculosis]EFD55846.1 conserved hypothetical protein [Mycoba
MCADAQPSGSVGLLGRNCPTATTRWRRAGEGLTAADTIEVKLWAGKPRLHPLVSKRAVGVLLAVAHGQVAKTPSATRAIAFRHVRLMRVRWICAGNRGRKHKRRCTTQYRSTQASKLQLHFKLRQTLNRLGGLQAMVSACG